MKDHNLHVRKKLKENRGKMKKLETSTIKRNQSISLGNFFSLF